MSAGLSHTLSGRICGGQPLGLGAAVQVLFFFFLINFISQVTQNSDIDKKIKTHTAAIKN